MATLRNYRVLFLLLVVLAGYFGYKWFRTRPPEVWKYIPDSASVIISSDKLQLGLTGVTDSIIAFRDLPLVSLASGSLSMVRWFNQDQEQVKTFLLDKNITYAFHPLAGNRLGIVVYLPVKNDLERKWLDNPKPGSLRVNSHNFQGHTITDISNERSESLFSYILKDDYLIVSQYGELIEDVIRNAKSGNSTASKVGGLTTLAEDPLGLSIYTNGNSWRDFIFASGVSSNISAILDMLPSRHGFHLQPGDSHDKMIFSSEDARKSENSLSGLFAGQTGTAFQNTSFISQQTTHLIRFALAGESKFQSAFRKWLSSRRTLPSVNAFEKATGKSRDAFYHQIGPEIMLSVNENSGGLSDNKIMLIRYADYEKAKPALQLAMSKTQPASSQSSAFQGYEIFPIMIPDLMEGLFGPAFKGFRESHITYIEPYLIVGNNTQSVRNYLIDYENQLTWSHAPGLDSLDVYQKEDAQLTLITNMSKVRAESERNRAGLKTSLDRIATSVLRYREDGKYANVELELNYSPEQIASSHNELKTDIEWKDTFPAVFSAMLNPIDGSSEILLTNQRNELIEINNSEAAPKVLAQLDGPMVGRAYKADFLNIGRQQRIVTTSSFLYVIDEDDNGFLTVLTDPTPTAVASIDRMNDARESSARFVIRGSDQHLYLWERVHKPAFRLNTKLNLENILVPVVSFAGVNSNQHIVTQSNGKIFVLDDKGILMKQFPVDMLSGISGSFAAIQNGTSGQTEIRGVNRQGEFARIGLDGRVLERKQLLLPEGGCTFKTIFDENSLDWLLLRRTASRAAFLSKDGNEIFEIVNLKKDFSVRYHYFGSDNRFISVVSGGLLSVFDFKGNRIGDSPIPCQGALGITYQGSKRELSIFSQADGKIQIWSVKLS